jgi:hypothetical protein
MSASRGDAPGQPFGHLDHEHALLLTETMLDLVEEHTPVINGTGDVDAQRGSFTLHAPWHAPFLPYGRWLGTAGDRRALDFHGIYTPSVPGW